MQYAALRRGAMSLAGSCPNHIVGQRYFHVSRAARAITQFSMPAMSPTMTEGGVASWKKKQGESFAAGDVLLEIETDKATIDVEAPEDGILGLIIAADGAKNVPVGKVIALLAEEGDDISNLKAPEEQATPSKTQTQASDVPPVSREQVTEAKHPSPKASHSGPLETSKPVFPSVLRILSENGVSSIDKIKGTGIRGMLTKGDVLAHLGKVDTPFGTYKKTKSPFPEKLSSTKPQQSVLLDGVATRRLIVESLIQASKPRASHLPPADFDAIISDYIPQPPSLQPPVLPLATKPTRHTADYLEGLI